MVSVLEELDMQELTREKALPNSKFSSDHTPLLANFKFIQ